jgi:hypothetical protein
VVLDRGAGCVRLDRLNAFLGIGLRLVTLAGSDDLADTYADLSTQTLMPSLRLLI